MPALPPEAMTVELSFSYVGVDRQHQQLVYAKVNSIMGALLVVRLLTPHPDGEVGRFYGTRLLGFMFDDVFRAYGTEPLGEMCWKDQEWVQVAHA